LFEFGMRMFGVLSDLTSRRRPMNRGCRGDRPHRTLARVTSYRHDDDAQPSGAGRPGSDVDRAKLYAAFAAVYFFWGSTYLAIRFTLETFPPFLFAGIRFLVAGGVLYAWAARRAPTPKAVHWRSAVIVGGLLLLGGNGGVVWAQQTVPSGLAALLVATEPLWIAIIVTITGRERLTGPVIVGLILGFAGVALLVGPQQLIGGEPVAPLGALVIGLAALSWAIGSLYSREAPQPPSQQLTTAMNMLAGGALLTVAALVAGDFQRFDPAGVSLKSLLALVYLIVFGALVAFSAYLWIMKAATPARASTYAYVNPVIAVVLGWLLAGEALSPRVIVSALVIVTAVALIVSRKPGRAGPTGS
jgi:drug/metabolite transporter (DMT)-like permease